MGHLVQPPWRSRVSYSRLHRTLSRQVLNISREGEISPVLLPEAESCVFWEVCYKKLKYLSFINLWCTFNKNRRTTSLKSEPFHFSQNRVLEEQDRLPVKHPKDVFCFQGAAFLKEIILRIVRSHAWQCCSRLLPNVTVPLVTATVRRGIFHNRNCAIRLASPRRIIKMWMINAGHVSCPARCSEIT